jgi:hypothetical protein
MYLHCVLVLINVMIKTIFNIALFQFILFLVSCGSKSPSSTPGSVEEAQMIIEARKAEQIKNADKIKKQTLKRNLKKQSKPVRKSLKKNKKRLKKKMKRLNY